VCGIINVIEWNEKNNIKVYRMSSNMFPWMSEYEFKDLPQYDDITTALLNAGNLARSYKQRLSFHPGPFNQLASIDKTIIEKTVKELNQHSEILDLMGYEASHWTKINIQSVTQQMAKMKLLNDFAKILNS